MTRGARASIRLVVGLALGAALACTPKRDPVRRDALDRLVTRARAEHTTALVVLHGGHSLVDTRDGAAADEALVTMSVSKTIVALAVLHLVEKKTIASLDVPLATWVPAWVAPDPRAAITLRHVMTHTSGLTAERAETWNGETLRAHAAASKLVAPVGTAFSYNDNAVDLLSLAVHGASGFYLDDYLTKHVLGPLDVAGAYWMKDAEGHPRAAGELFMRPRDVAKIGELLLGHGAFGGKRILEASSIATLATTSPREPTYGHLVWLHDGALVGKGYLGQWLVVDERSRIVAVRMRTPRPEEFRDPVEHDTYPDFWRDVIALAR